ncbi:MAG: MFS transporter [Sneathiellaceae bacterium]
MNTDSSSRGAAPSAGSTPPDAADPDQAEPATSTPAQQGWYLSGVGAWFAAFGIQAVVFPWITTFLLHESAERIGLAQAALWLPLLAFLLVGGALADRVDPRRVLIVLHLVALLPPAAVAILELAGALAYWPIIAYGLAMGTVMAFLQPSRDALLSRVAGGRIQRMVMMATALQFGTQLCGTLAAGLTGILGLIPVLGAQALMLGFGAFSASRLRPAPPAADRREPALAAILAGLRLVWQDPMLRTVVAMGTFIGLFYVGGFVVILPVLVREFYGSGEHFAAFYAVWAAGNVATLLALLRLGMLAHPGRALLLAMLASSVCMLVASATPAAPWIYLLMAIWGGVAGISASMSRTIVQQLAPHRHRARVLATFQLGFFGSVPVGAFLGGLLVGAVGSAQAMWAAPVCILPLTLWVLAGRRIWAYRPPTGS